MTGVPLRDVHDRLAGEATPAPAAAASTSTPSSPQAWFTNWATGNPGGQPGPAVNEQTALTYLTVFACVDLIAATISSLPLVTYRQSGRSRRPAHDLPEYGLLHDEPNPRMTAATARETGVGHLLTWGNSYSQVVRNKSGSAVLQLNPLGPDVVRPRVDDRSAARDLVYDVHQRGTGQVVETLPAADVLHVPGLGFDGLVGYSPVRVARAAIRAGMAQDQEAEKFVTRGIRPPGAIQFPAGKKFNTTADAVQYRDRIRALHANPDSALSVMVLEDGTTWQDIGVDPVSAQMLESRQYSGTQICGFYRVPPHMVGLVEKVSSWGTGIEEQVGGFVKFSLLRWLVKIEQETNRKLFGPGADVFCEHNLDALMRGDLLKRTQALKEQLMCGALSPNEMRELENRDPHPGGDVFFFPLNMARMDKDGNDLPPPEGYKPTADPKPAQ